MASSAAIPAGRALRSSTADCGAPAGAGRTCPIAPALERPDSSDRPCRGTGFAQCEGGEAVAESPRQTASGRVIRAQAALARDPGRSGRRICSGGLSGARDALTSVNATAHFN